MRTASGRVGPQDEGMRADRFVCDGLELLSRSQLASRLIAIRVNGKEVKRSRTVHDGDLVEAEIAEAPEVAIEAEELPLEIIYENEDVIVVNKPCGMVVHPAAGNHSGTLVQGLLYHITQLADQFPAEPMRPGIVHRLDRETSGVIIAAKHPAAHRYLAEQFRARETEKRYIAIVKGRPRPARGMVEGRIRRDRHHRKRFEHLPESQNQSGKHAVTEYECLRSHAGYSLVLCRPITGRTHQIRVHMQSLGTPVAGDPLYARHSAGDPQRMLLHAFRLRITLPGEAAQRTFTAALPEEFKRAFRAQPHPR